MLEGLTYWDMGRMLKAQSPASEYKLYLHDQFSGNGKIVGREFLEPSLEKDLKFELHPDHMIQTWGKTMGLAVHEGELI